MPRLSTIALLSTATALAPLLAQAQLGYDDPPGQGRAVVCESREGDYRECATGFRGPAVLRANLSETRCVEGRNWGSTGRGSVWVRDGCRGSCAEGYGGGPIGGGQGYHGQTVRCESDDNRYRECSMPSRGDAQLVRQLSETACVQGRNWGQRSGRVWVSGGCRGEFASTSGWGGGSGGGWNGGSGDWQGGGYTVTCNSEGQRTVTCPWDARQGRARLVQQLSESPCREGYSWGTDGRSRLWVSRGCRGRFAGR